MFFETQLPSFRNPIAFLAMLFRLLLQNFLLEESREMTLVCRQGEEVASGSVTKLTDTPGTHLPLAPAPHRWTGGGAQQSP